jgi:hypothetical protein
MYLVEAKKKTHLKHHTYLLSDIASLFDIDV